MTRSLAALVAVVFALNTVSLPLDWWVFSDQIGLFFTARGALFAVLGVVYFRTRFTHPMASTVASVFAMGLMLLTMVWADGGVRFPSRVIPLPGSSPTTSSGSGSSA